jgi:hypothetical protein
MQLYKYCRGEHFRALKERGVVRIGTLADFRRTDRYGELTGDALEGSKSPNAMVFSASSQYDIETHRRWKELEGYDTCYVIHSARLFAKGVTRALGKSYGFIDGCFVQYELAPAMHLAFVKREVNHIEQAEVRLAWAPRLGAPVEPQIFAKSEVFKYVSLHAEI